VEKIYWIDGVNTCNMSNVTYNLKQYVINHDPFTIDQLL